MVYASTTTTTEKKKITVKTAHIKAKKHTVTPSYIQSPVRAWTQAHTQRDRFTISAHFSFGRSMRLKIHLDLQSNTVKNFFKNKLEKSRMSTNDSTPTRTANKVGDGSN